MKKTLMLPDTISACHELILQQAALIERLQGRPFRGSLKDRAVKHEGPSLFEEYDEEARLVAAKELEKASKDVEVAAKKRRDELAQQCKGRGKRPERYNTYGLPKTVTTVYPEGVNTDEYDVIGQDETRVLHLEPQRLWVEKIVTPVLRRKADKNNPNPDIQQAPRPHSIIGGGHVGADLLATLINNKFNHHLPEYRQVKMFAELGLNLPTSTVLDTRHGQCALSSLRGPARGRVRRTLCAGRRGSLEYSRPQRSIMSQGLRMAVP